MTRAQTVKWPSVSAPVQRQQMIDELLRADEEVQLCLFRAAGSGRLRLMMHPEKLASCVVLEGWILPGFAVLCYYMWTSPKISVLKLWRLNEDINKEWNKVLAVMLYLFHKCSISVVCLWKQDLVQSQFNNFCVLQHHVVVKQGCCVLRHQFILLIINKW